MKENLVGIRFVCTKLQFLPSGSANNYCTIVLCCFIEWMYFSFTAASYFSEIIIIICNGKCTWKVRSKIIYQRIGRKKKQSETMATMESSDDYNWSSFRQREVHVRSLPEQQNGLVWCSSHTRCAVWSAFTQKMWNNAWLISLSSLMYADLEILAY